MNLEATRRWLVWSWLALGLAAESCGHWPVTRGDAASTGSSETALADSLRLLWQFRLDGLGFDSGPIIAAGRVYAADADGQIVALTLTDGQPLWTQKLATGFMASPAYHEGRLYIGDLDGVVRALDASTGEVVWTFDAQREIDAGANFYQNNLLVTSQSGSLLALDRQQGTLQWQYDTDDQLRCNPGGKLTF